MSTPLVVLVEAFIILSFSIFFALNKFDLDVPSDIRNISAIS